MSKKNPTVKDMPDEVEFKLSEKSNVSYTMQTKEKHRSLITSVNSGRSFWVKNNRRVYNI